MKSIALLLAATQAVSLYSGETVLWIKQASAPVNHSLIQYAESEGPTKADNGESDQDWFILQREHDINVDDSKASGWTNPLSWADNGDDDDNVVCAIIT